MDTLPYRSQLKEFLNLGLDRCMKAVKGRSGSIFLLDEGKKELILEIAKNINNIGLEGIRGRLGERVAGRVALERKPFLVKNIDKEACFLRMFKYPHYQTKSFLSVPLDFSGGLIGVINITDKYGKEVFNRKDFESIVAIAGHLGFAIHSLKNYTENQNRINEKLIKEVENLKNSTAQSKKFSSLGKFVGGLVHEINNPLDGVIRYVNLALDCAEEKGVAREYLEEALRGLSRITHIVRSFSDFSSSFSAGQGKIDVNSAVEESLVLQGHYITAYNIKVEKVFAPDLPELADYWLKLVFNNIIRNACEAMEEGGILSVSTGINNGSVEIRFKDTGEGMPLDLQDKVFEPFFTTKDSGKGSGLGLAICYGIIQQYNGTIGVKSALGQGTTFVITLPANNKVYHSTLKEINEGRRQIESYYC